MIGYLVLAARVALGLVLLVSTVTKTHRRIAFLDFLGWLRQLTVVPERLVVSVGVAMVVAEGTAVVLVALPATWVAGLVLAAVILAFFAGAIGWLTRRGMSAPCRCFGTSTRPMGTAEIVRNLLLVVASSAAAVTAMLNPLPDPPTVDVLSAVLLGGALAMVAVRFDDIAAVLAPLPADSRARSVVLR